MTRRSKPEELALHEEFVLLCLHDNKGTIRSGKCRLGIAGALAAELLFQGLIAIDASRRRKPVVADNSRWLNDPVLNDCLQQIRHGKPQVRLATWMLILGYNGGFAHRIARRLCWRGILRAEEKFSLTRFSRKHYPEIDPDPERAVIERLREAIFTDVVDVSPRTAVLAGLANACDLLKPVFGGKELKSREIRLQQLAGSQRVGESVGAAVKAAQTVVNTVGAVGATAASAAGSALIAEF